MSGGGRNGGGGEGLSQGAEGRGEEGKDAPTWG